MKNVRMVDADCCAYCKYFSYNTGIDSARNYNARCELEDPTEDTFITFCFSNPFMIICENYIESKPKQIH